jgi:two-component system NtrC family response regulator
MGKRRKIRRSIIASQPNKGLRILFADDEKYLQELMSNELPRLGHEVTVCPDGLTAAAALDINTYDCILVDLDMPGLNGIEVITKCKQLSSDTEAIVLTGKSSLDSAVSALRQGAFDYLTKPCKLLELESLLKRIVEKKELKNENEVLKREMRRIVGKTQLVGNGASMQQVRALIAKVAPTNSTVLVLGETGTGKELVARSLHEQSLRAEKPFVAINCGALPESLIESELFGHRKGAFTGADEHRKGLFEVADGGTLFLDEIGELPKAMQAKLLRFLESGEIRRVGDNEAMIVDVRVLCATHRDLVEMVEDSDFREDLMFRINTFEIQLPTLRERLEDLPELCTHLLCRFRKPEPLGGVLSDDVLATLRTHTWPGNVRELANVIEHASILCERGAIREEHLPVNFETRRLRGPQLAAIGPMTLRDLEMQAIEQTLGRHAGNKPDAARELGISLKTLYNKLNQAVLKESA